MINFPNIDPVAIYLGPLKIHWYGLAYLVGICLCWCQARVIAPSFAVSQKSIDDFITYAVVGIIVGGRLGFVLFYDLAYHLQHPQLIVQTWQGGMSFHGGLLGVVLAGAYYCKRYKIEIAAFGDVWTITVPLGLLFGRLANFINAEHFGRPTTVPWGMVFPHSDGLPRHPSQLYEAFFEGVLLWGVMWAAYKWKQGRVNKLPQLPGFYLSLFLFGYGAARFGVEYLREPDGIYQLFGILFTTGQLLTLPMLLLGGLGLVYLARFRKQ